jgi:hypothetical protein
MSRRHSGPVTKISMSPTKLSTALDLDYRTVIAPAVRSGDLPCYVIGVKHRVLIEDAVAFIRKQKKVRPHD